MEQKTNYKQHVIDLIRLEKRDVKDGKKFPLSDWRVKYNDILSEGFGRFTDVTELLQGYPGLKREEGLLAYIVESFKLKDKIHASSEIIVNGKKLNRSQIIKALFAAS